MTIILAKFISTILNPLVVTIFAPYILIYRTTSDSYLALSWTVYTVIYLALLGIFVMISVKKKVFSDMDVSKREQRPLLFFVSLLFSTIYLTSIFLLRAPIILIIFAISVLIGVSFAYIINTRIKASMHVAAITAFAVPVAISYRNAYLFLLLLVPLVGWARLVAKRHSFSEVIVGGFVGGLLSLSIYLTVKTFIAY